MPDSATLAKLAYQEALVKLAKSVSDEALIERLMPADRINDAEYYIEFAFDVLLERGNGYDPRTRARANAEQAVKTFTVASLLGEEPDTYAPFRQAEKAWLRAAALSRDETEFHNNPGVMGPTLPEHLT